MIKCYEAEKVIYRLTKILKDWPKGTTLHKSGSWIVFFCLDHDFETEDEKNDNKSSERA